MSLHDAAKGGHTEVVSILLERGAVIEANDMGYTALHVAASRGHVEVVSLLLENGAEIQGRVYRAYGQTALHFASSGGHAQVASLLLGKGADTNASDDVSLLYNMLFLFCPCLICCRAVANLTKRSPSYEPL